MTEQASTARTSKKRPRLPWKSWWRSQSHHRQDRIAALAPLYALVLFLVAIVTALTYFTMEEIEREQESVVRDVDYAQQRLRLRLIESQEALLKLAWQQRDMPVTDAEFRSQIEALRLQYPEIHGIGRLNPAGELQALQVASNEMSLLKNSNAQSILQLGVMDSFRAVRDKRIPTYTRPLKTATEANRLLLFVPMDEELQFSGAFVAEYDLDTLMRFGVPSEVMARYAVALVGENQAVLAGRLQYNSAGVLRRLPWSLRPQSHQVSVTPMNNGIELRAVGYRTDKSLFGNALFWLVGAISLFTAWTLVGNVRHTRRRIAAQRALVSETNFRRAMENSMLTGMRAHDLKGRIIYVNPAFCSMTGWSEEELIGARPPYPFWPESDLENNMAHAHQIYEEMLYRSSLTGHEISVKRKNGSIFAARVYISPLIDSSGEQTGWMTSITDISEPKRIRQELTASHERFTTVLDSLDAAISVTPLGSMELLFANKMYRTWFSGSGHGHRAMIDYAVASPLASDSEQDDHVDSFAGLPTDSLLDASTENTEVFIPELGKWLEMRTRYLTWVDGRLAQMVIATDITARRQAEEQAAKQSERAETASRLITMGEMASSVAHELNQPLTAISNYCSGMIARIQKQQMNEADLLGALEKTARQAQRAGQIIQRIRAFVKRSEPNPTPSDVAQMVTNATELAEIELRRQSIRLNTYMAARLPQLMVDPILIEQVLINLIKNAGESILHAQRPVGQRQIELCVTPKQVDGNRVIEFSITDNGTGVPQEKLERIYEAFYSTKAEGMGIGLKLCRSIVESHHGRLKARNLYNGEDVTGCEFSFWIPVPTQPQP